MTTLRGRVTTAGAPAPTSVVELHNASDDIVDQVQVDADGRYQYHLAPGEWSVRVWDRHGNRGKGTVTLAEGDETTLDVELEAEGS